MSYCTLRWAYEQKLGPIPKNVLVALAFHADKNGECFPSQALLAEKTGFSERSVRDGLKELTALGLIVRAKHYRSDGTRGVDRIRVTNYRQDAPVVEPTTGTTGNDYRQDAPSLPARGAALTTLEQPYEQPYELKISPLAPQTAKPEPAEPEPPPKAKPPPRGSRIPDDLTLSDEWLQFALSKGLSHDDASGTFDEFLDYWRGVPGPRGLKSDWFATWRNRVRAIAQRLGENSGYVPRRNGRSNDSLLGAYQRAASRFSN